MQTEGLIVELPERIHVVRKPEKVLDINPEIVFGKMIVKKGYVQGEFKHVVEEFKELPSLVRPFLQTIARHPLWRKDHCGNKEISDWGEYKKTRGRKIQFKHGWRLLHRLFVSERKKTYGKTQKKTES